MMVFVFLTGESIFNCIAAWATDMLTYRCIVLGTLIGVLSHQRLHLHCRNLCPTRRPIFGPVFMIVQRNQDGRCCSYIQRKMLNFVKKMYSGHFVVVFY